MDGGIYSKEEMTNETPAPETTCVQPIVFVDAATVSYGQKHNFHYSNESQQGTSASISYQNDKFQYPLDCVTTLQQTYPDLDIPDDLTPISFTQSQAHTDVRKRPFSRAGEEIISELYQVFESSAPADSAIDSNHKNRECVNIDNEEDQFASSTNTTAASTSRPNRTQKKQKKVSSDQDKLYRSDREYVKRHSHKKMIWFFRKVGLRHPAAVRTHLEKVKHPEFEIPNLQCVLPHPSLSVAFDEKFEAEHENEPVGYRKRKTESNIGSGCANRNEPNMTFYQLYCATTTLVERVRKLLGEPHRQGENQNKRVLTFIADIVGRLLWHNNRTHTVMFAKSDHYDRECFLLYSRQAEPTPFMMKSDKYFCRRHDSDKFRFIAPQPDLTRANSSRLSNESSIYVVGCNAIEIWESFPYEYRATRSRPMKSLYDRIRKIDPSVLEHAFSSVNRYLNGERQQSPYVEVASRTSFDVLSVFLRDSNLRDIRLDDSVEYRNYVERFIVVGVQNVHCMLKTLFELKRFGSYRDNTVWQPSLERLDQIVLHHVHYRREVRELMTNRVFYYRNANDFICSLSLLDDMFEGGITAEDVGERGERNENVVYFYDLLQPSEYDETDDVNDLALQCWNEVETMIQESSYTIRNRLTNDVLKGPLPEDPFYPKSDMSPTDVAIDRMLERAIKHSKKLQLLTPTLVKCSEGQRPTRIPSTGGTKDNSTRKRTQTKRRTRAGERKLQTVQSTEEFSQPNREAIMKSLSRTGENRIQEGYVSPLRPAFLTDHHVEHNGHRYHVKISASSLDGGSKRRMTTVDYGPQPCVQVDRKLVCVYFIDPSDVKQIHVAPGSQIIERTHPEFQQLRVTDRIVRVFAIHAVTNDSYVVKPYVYFVFRNCPICSIPDSLVSQLFKEVESYENFHGFNLLHEFNSKTYQYMRPTEQGGCVPFEPLQKSQENEDQVSLGFDVQEALGILPQQPNPAVPVPADNVKHETIDDYWTASTSDSHRLSSSLTPQQEQQTEAQSFLQSFEEFILPETDILGET